MKDKEGLAKQSGLKRALEAREQSECSWNRNWVGDEVRGVSRGQVLKEERIIKEGQWGNH